MYCQLIKIIIIIINKLINKLIFNTYRKPTTCRAGFRRFKKNDFKLEDKECSDAPKKFEQK